MKTINSNPVVLNESDYSILKRLAGLHRGPDETMSLRHEIDRAIVVKDEAFPPNTIRLNSWVTVLDVESGEETQFCLVLPGAADIKQRKISVLTPMAAALIGFREGDEVEWKMPAGMKTFKVLSVNNNPK